MSDLIPSNLGNFIFSLDNLDNSKTLFSMTQMWKWISRKLGLGLLQNHEQKQIKKLKRNRFFYIDFHFHNFYINNDFP